MSKLQIDFHCLCVFVPDVANGAVHVLMPATGAHGNGNEHHGDHDHTGEGAHEHEQHVVRIIHPTLPQGGVPMEGWALVLGGGDPIDQASFQPVKDATIVDLTELTGNRLERAVLLDAAHPKVAARVTLRGGKLETAEGEGKWTLGGSDVLMSTHATWTIDDVTPEAWVSLGAAEPHPLDLSTLPTNQGDTIRLDIYHVTESGLPPNEGQLSESQIRGHFRALLEFFGVTSPSEQQLPRARFAPSDGFNCPNAHGKTGG